MRFIKYLILAMITFSLMMLIQFLLGMVFTDPEWTMRGIPIIVTFVVLDLTRKIDPDLFPELKPIFTNVRDFIVFVAAFSVGSALTYIPEWSGDERFLVRLLTFILALAVMFFLVFFFGTRQLYDIFWRGIRKDKEPNGF